MIKEVSENYTFEFSQSEISSHFDNTLIEGAEVRKKNLLTEFEFQNLVIRHDSLSVQSENDTYENGYPNPASKINCDKSVKNDNTSELGSLSYSLTRDRNLSRQNYRKSILNINQQTLPQVNSIDSDMIVPIQKIDFHEVRTKKKSISMKHNPTSTSETLRNGPSTAQGLQDSKNNIVKSKKPDQMTKIHQILKLKSMIQRIMRYLPSVKYSKLQQIHFEAINDKSLVLKDLNGFSSMLAQFPTLKPNQILFDIWKILQIISVGFHLFRVILMLGFQDESLTLQPTIRIVSLIFFILDCFLGINAGFYQGLAIITDRFRIFEKNALEIASAGISAFAMIYSNNSYLNLIFIIRLKPLFSNISIIEQNFSLNQKYPILVTITKLLLLIILIAHTFACGFILITHFEKESLTSWIKKQALIGESWEKIYLTGLYFAFITMITVGYGDITPVTDIERAYVIFFTLITCIVYAYVVNTIGSLFSEFALKSAQFKKQRFQIISYLNDRRISKQTQISIIKYLEYTQQQENVLDYSKVGEQFLSSIPNSLRQEVCQEYYGRILNSVSLFKRYLSKNCIYALSQIMKEESFGPEERIFSQNDLDFKFIFVISGKVEILVNLGDASNSSRCLGYVKEVYCMLRDASQSDMEVLDMKCTSCQQKDHYANDCDLMLYQPRKSFLISKYNYYFKQEKRDELFLRKRTHSSNSWKSNMIVRRQLKKLRISILNKEFNNIICKLSKKKVNLFDLISEDNPELDEQFFTAIPEFYFQENEITIALDEQDLNFSSDSSSQDCQQYQNDLEQEFNQLLLDLSNSTRNKRIRPQKHISYKKLTEINPFEINFNRSRSQNPSDHNENGDSHQVILERKFSNQLDSLPENSNPNQLTNYSALCCIGKPFNHMNSISTSKIINENTSNSPPQNGNQNNIFHQSSSGNSQSPASFPSVKSNLYNTPFFFSPGEISVPWNLQDSHTLQTQQHTHQQVPILLGGIARSTSYNQKNLSLPPVQRSTSSDRSQGFTSNVISRQLQQIQNSHNNINSAIATQSGIVSSNSTTEMNNPEMVSAEDELNQLQGLIQRRSDQEIIRDNNIGDKSQDKDLRIILPSYYPKQSHKHKSSFKNNKTYNKQINGSNSDQDQGQLKRKSKKNITYSKDQMILSLKSTKERGFTMITSNIQNHLLPISQKNISFEDQMMNAEGRFINNNNDYIQSELQAKQIFVIMNFDQIQEYQHYFPNFNYSCLRFKNKTDSTGYQHGNKTRRQTYVFKKNLYSIKE